MYSPSLSGTQKLSNVIMDFSHMSKFNMDTGLILQTSVSHLYFMYAGDKMPSDSFLCRNILGEN